MLAMNFGTVSFTHESKHLGKQSAKTNKYRSQPSATLRMMTVFSNYKCALLLHFKEPDVNINANNKKAPSDFYVPALTILTHPKIH